MSTILIRTLLFLLPFVVFLLLFRFVRERRKEVGPIDKGTVRLVVGVSAATLTILILVLIFLNIGRTDNLDQNYVAPRANDGEIEPGHFEEPDPPDDETEPPEDENAGH